ncbi:MAG TPA: helix-turn-helix domain-containing protein [Steroidobacteraceae bacterium]|jgi:AraC family ethanolamine operon transcriptional activator|nr:helix-turn-helix domain-containing protein [Steroidobacteraceae bacterium]
MNAPSPFAFDYTSRRSRDPFAHANTATGWSNTYEQLAPGPFEASTQQLSLGSLQIFDESIGCGFSYRGRPWRGSRVFFSYLSDTACRYYDARPVASDTVVSHRWDAVERVMSPHPIRLALVAVEEKLLLDQLEDLLDCSGAAALAAVTSTNDPRLVRIFQASVLDVLRELEQSPQAIDDQIARGELQARIIDMLVELASDSMVSTRSLPPPTTRAYVVRRAVEIMEEGLPDATSVTDLCRKIRVCPRTLRYSFAEVTGVSPTQFLLSMRLNGARRTLLSRGNHAPVHVVAARWGFWHMSRFARYYRVAFGERPSDTLAGAARRRS